MDRVRDKIAIVTGGALGLGAASARMLAREGDVAEGRKTVDAMHPLGHVGEHDDIAYGIVYLASDESKFVTGAELVIDGGYRAQ